MMVTIRLSNVTDPSTQSAERMNAWDGRVRLFIVGAAVIPVLSALFFESATHPLIIVIDGAAWLIFAADLLVRRRLVPGYLHSGSGRFDALIVFMTFPWYLIPGVGERCSCRCSDLPGSPAW
jgi:hypothetical protein